MKIREAIAQVQPALDRRGPHAKPPGVDRYVVLAELSRKALRYIAHGAGCPGAASCTCGAHDIFVAIAKAVGR